jgi:hypothetical protein
MNRRILRFGAGLAVTSAFFLLLTAPAPGADHRDGPKITDVNQPYFDLNDLYIFRAPGNSANTVLILTVSPFAGMLAPETFNSRARYEVRIDQNLDNLPDLTLRATFGTPSESSPQTVKLTMVRAGRPAQLLAEGDTNTNIPIEGGGMFRAGIQDDPFFFDAAGFNLLVDDGIGTFPRITGTASNFFGPDVNTLAVIIELPTVRLLKSADRPIIRAWTRILNQNGTQIDRVGQPLLNIFGIPPVPRNDTTHRDLRDAFNRGNPDSDSRRYRAEVVSVLTTFWKNSPGRAGALVDRFLLPNVITFDTSLTFEGDGFPNGRRLRDDVADYMLNLMSNGLVTTDNVNDDNGDRITDGTARPGGSIRPIAFPYIGARNQ